MINTKISGGGPNLYSIIVSVADGIHNYPKLSAFTNEEQIIVPVKLKNFYDWQTVKTLHDEMLMTKKHAKLPSIMQTRCSSCLLVNPEYKYILKDCYQHPPVVHTE